MIFESRNNGADGPRRDLNENAAGWGAMEYDDSTGKYKRVSVSATDSHANACNIVPRLGFNHFDADNLLYADGHVKWRKYDTLRAGDWTVQDD
jgi:hypothetical protein